MEQLPNGYTLEIPEGCFPLSTDSMVLAWFAGKQKDVLDLGSGCGSLGLLLCAGNPGCHVTGIELNDTAHRAALDNIARNHLEGRMESICADLRTVPSRFSPGSVSCCISNPPYFSGGPKSQRFACARQDDMCSIPELMEAAAWALKYGGDFYLVHRPERLGELIAAGAGKGLEAKRLGVLRHAPESPRSVVLLQLRKGGKPGLKWEELVLHQADGSPTALYREIYHIQEE